MECKYLPGKQKDYVNRGTLFDVSKLASTLGFEEHVLLSKTVWNFCVVAPKPWADSSSDTDRILEILEPVYEVAYEKKNRPLSAAGNHQSNGAFEIYDLVACYTKFDSGPRAIKVNLANEYLRILMAIQAKAYEGLAAV